MAFGAEEFRDNSGDNGFSLLPVKTVARPTTNLCNSFMKITSCNVVWVRWGGKAFANKV